MDFKEKLEYILNFDENKLFNTELDDKYTDKELYRRDIQTAKNRFKEYLEINETTPDTARAFDFCKMYLTDTPHQAIAEHIIKALNPRNMELLWFIDYLILKLQEVENEN